MIIIIGNAVPCFDKKKYIDGDIDLSAWWSVEETVEHSDAPCFENDNAKNTNYRNIAYPVWQDFCLKTGLYDFFNDRDDCFRGLITLTESDYLVMREARKKREKHPLEFPDFYLMRLIWLEFWVRWALDNCETPAIGIK